MNLFILFVFAEQEIRFLWKTVDKGGLFKLAAISTFIAGHTEKQSSGHRVSHVSIPLCHNGMPKNGVFPSRVNSEIQLHARTHKMTISTYSITMQ